MPSFGLTTEKLIAFFWKLFTVMWRTNAEARPSSTMPSTNSQVGRLPKALRSIRAIGDDNGKYDKI